MKKFLLFITCFFIVSIQGMETNSSLVWIDLEMTGLDPNRERIVEIAAIITDAYGNIRAEGPSVVIHQEESVLKEMDDFVENMHTKSGLLEAIGKSNQTEADAQETMLNFIRAHVSARTGILAGDCVWHDREFLRKYMPTLAAYLHPYNIIDINSNKLMLSTFHSQDALKVLLNGSKHRAMDDIRQSIAEYKHLLQFIKR